MKERLALAGLLLVALAIRLPTLAQPLVEAHAFRQTQTAYTALLYARDGVDLLHPRVPVLGPPYGLAFEFPLFQAIAAIPIALGAPADPALRTTGLSFFLASAALLWLLVRRYAGTAAAFATLVAYLFSPFALLWSRTSLIEYLVITASLAYLLAGLAWRDRGGSWLWVTALLAGSVAMAVKITSGAIWIVPLLAYRPGTRSWREPRLLALAAVPLGAGLIWTRYADGLRASAAGTAWMTSVDLAPFLFGTPQEHLSLRPWVAILFYIGAWVAGPALIGLLMRSAGAIRGRPLSLFWTAVVACPLFSIVVFLHVWSIHDYYSIAATPSVAVAIGLAAAWLWQTRAARALPLVIVPGVVLACASIARTSPSLALGIGGLVGAVLIVVWTRRGAFTKHVRARLLGTAALALALNVAATVDYWGVAYVGTKGNEYVLAATELDRYTTAGESVLMTGHDWSPVVLYYARREGQMLPSALLNDSFVASLRAQGYRTFFSWDPAMDALWPATQWPWIGALAPHTFALGETRSDLRGAKAISTDDASAFSDAAAGGRRVAHPASIRCGQVTELLASRGLWLRLGPAGRDARIAVLSVGLGAMPARSVMVISPGLAGDGMIRLGCAGADAITILDAVEAP